MNIAEPSLSRIRALRRASRPSDETVSQIALDIKKAREVIEANKPRRGRKERNYLEDFGACFPDFPPAKTYEQLFFRIAIISGLLGSDAKAYEYVAARHPTGRCDNGAPILPEHLADARKNNLKAERAAVKDEVTIRKTRWPRLPRRKLAYRRLVAGLKPESGSDEIHRSRVDRVRQRETWLSMGVYGGGGQI